MFDTSERGSRRIPKKYASLRVFRQLDRQLKLSNQRAFLTISLLALTIQIAEISEAYGATVPWLRSSALSDDFTDTDTVLFHETKKIMQTFGDFQYACCVYPKLLTKELIVEGLNLLQN